MLHEGGLYRRIRGMYLRPNRRTLRGETYEYWTLVDNQRTARGPRQRIVATLGKAPGLDREERVGWERIGRILDGKSESAPTLFDRGEEPPEWAHVDIGSVQVERLRQFGNVYLALALWRRLHLDELLDRLQGTGREDVRWSLMACVLATARFCSPRSELAIAEHWYGQTALDDLLGIAPEKINEDRLYRALDHLWPHKDEVCRHLQTRYTEWFGSDFDFLFYDITSTYFEGQALSNEQARRGYSRDNRPDCAQVCIGLVVNRDGLPVAYELFDGNRADVTTFDEVVEIMERKYGQARRIWVVDRGMVSEENLAALRDRGARYIVGTPRSMLRRFESELTTSGWEEVQPHVEVKILSHPDYGTERFVLCRSQGRQRKEQAMLQRQMDRLENKLRQIQRSVQAGRLKSAAAAERRIGRWMGRYERAEQVFAVEVLSDQGRATQVRIERREAAQSWAQAIHGHYLLRTNLPEESPATLWSTYMQLTQAEAAFRITKSDLGLRPVFHQKAHRVQAHVFVCFLALAMWKSLELWMKAKGLGTCARRLVEEMAEVRSLDVILPVKDRSAVRLRLVGRPEQRLGILLQQLGLPLPNRGKRIAHVVEKNHPQTPQTLGNPKI